MIFSVACLLTCCLMLRARREVSKKAELLVLRHVNAVLSPMLRHGGISPSGSTCRGGH